MLSWLCRLLHIRHGLWDEMMRRGGGGGGGDGSMFGGRKRCVGCYAKKATRIGNRRAPEKRRRRWNGRRGCQSLDSRLK